MAECVVCGSQVDRKGRSFTSSAPSREQIAAVLYDAHHIKPTMDEQEAMTDAILELLEQHGWRMPDVLHEEAE